MKDVGHCPLQCEKINSVLSRIGDRWSILVMIALKGRQVMRFNELKRHLGITQRMLSLTLRELERDGLVNRTAYATVPPTVEYELTDLGQSFAETIGVMGEWAVEHLAEIDRARAEYDRRNAA
ncbi:MAG: transcriptional regulator [Marivivens sp.]|jgi:DNA-binding HxlR family transcriptional regulator|uniref:winged helix-turn-helix transcriptional regulator n=1 Tax=Marivivens sp. TaxID=1978374 RepID=UPI00201F51B1|nr:helix-turn-helix domain-containing protein [Marivivens sp.]MCL7404782.1 helix-turn-helix transcriptional regulator [Marivivens geojensis]NBQ49727.1 transcriptional regulator [Marivivens sp.]NBT52502.1 transcriptional regulator [Marivivens sp.]NBX10282.1 transcriptional regulator [Marivivens sp.]NCW67632.1 transcriptional regulator [Marivivens sp.]